MSSNVTLQFELSRTEVPLFLINFTSQAFKDFFYKKSVYLTYSTRHGS